MCVCVCVSPLPRRQVVLKLHIEGSEYSVLRRIMLDGSLCRLVDRLLIFFHPTVPGIPEGFHRTFRWLLDSPECGVELTFMDV